MPNQPDLCVDFCGLQLANPILLGSGGLGESAEGLETFLAAGAGGVVTRTLRLHLREDRRLFPSPHLTVGPDKRYMLNCEWGNQREWDYWLREGLPRIQERGAVILSLSGRCIEDCIELARRLDVSRPKLYEINVSCSHAGHLYGRIGDDAQHLTRLVTGLKRATKTPIMVKLGWSPQLPRMAEVAVAAGADAISTTNSIGPGLDLDLSDGRPLLGIRGGAGGLSGRALFPIALAAVHQVVEAVDVPVMGVGGISSYREVVKMLMVGATCVQLYTEALLTGPGLFPRIAGELTTYLSENGLASVDQLRGASRPYLRRESNLEPLVPEIHEDRCTPCHVCSRICPADAINVDTTARIDASSCTGCGMCVDVCPPAFKAIRKTCESI